MQWRHPERSRGLPLRDSVVVTRDSSTPLRFAENDRLPTSAPVVPIGVTF